MAHWHRFGVAVGITALVGCGNPTPDGPVSSPSTGSAAAVVSPPVSDAPRDGLAANAPARQAPTQTSPLGPTAQPVSTSEALLTDASRATSPAHDARAQTAASPADAPPSDEQTTAEYAQREARYSWGTEMREHPDVTVRLQTLELWAEQPDDKIDPVTYALVDQDEQVRAQELWEEQLTQEVDADAP